MITWSPGLSVSRVTPWRFSCRPAPHSTAYRTALPLRVLALDVHERVRVAEEELHQLALDRFGLVFEIGRRERVVRGDRLHRIDERPHERHSRQSQKQLVFHRRPPEPVRLPLNYATR